MEPDRGPIRRDDETATAADTDIRATVDWYFGDLVDEVAADYAVSCEQLVGALANIEREASARRDQLAERGRAVSTAGAPGEVLALPVGTLQVLTRACDLSGEESEAARSVHRRMAQAIARLPDEDATDAIVFAAEPSDLH
jgi:hypothetical protein